MLAKFLKQATTALLLAAVISVPSYAFAAAKKTQESKNTASLENTQEILKKASDAYKEKRYTEAMALLKPVADKGHPDAQFAVGLMYVRGDGVKQDYKLVKEYWTKAANSGSPESQFNLGLAYIRGIFGKREPLEAAKWWEKAASNGHGDAYYALAQMYRSGDGVAKNPAKAIPYDEKGAELGHPGCMYNLGMAYAKGDGVPKDIPKAKILLSDVAKTGDVAAKEALNALEKQESSKAVKGKTPKK